MRDVLRNLATDSRRARRPARRAASGAGAGLALSVLVHTAAAVTLGVVVHAKTRAPAPQQESVEVDVAPASNVPGEPTAASAGPSDAAGPTPTAVRAPHRARARAPRASLEAPAAASAAGDTPRFVLTAGTVATLATPSTSGAVGTSASGGVASSTDILTEGQVDAPARLLSTSPVVYPPAARRAYLELDFPLEIVVDTDGRVSTARALSRAGFGVDEAALNAIRLYRFSPALRAGHPVRVRMRWTIQFRLG